MIVFGDRALNEVIRVRRHKDGAYFNKTNVLRRRGIDTEDFYLPLLPSLLLISFIVDSDRFPDVDASPAVIPIHHLLLLPS